MSVIPTTSRAFTGNTGFIHSTGAGPPGPTPWPIAHPKLKRRGLPGWPSTESKFEFMGWSIGYDEGWKRDIGYGVPAWCDHPECDKEIDRGLSFVCGGEPYGGQHGCGLYFCEDHRMHDNCGAPTCERCAATLEPFKPKPDHPVWMLHKLTDDSWAKWRELHPHAVISMRHQLDNIKPTAQNEPKQF